MARDPSTVNDEHRHGFQTGRLAGVLLKNGALLQGRPSTDEPRHRFVQGDAVPVIALNRHRPDEADGWDCRKIGGCKGNLDISAFVL